MQDNNEPRALSPESMDLMAGYALGALDSPQEMAQAEALLADPLAAAELAAYREVAGELARAGALAPPAALRQQVLDAAAAQQDARLAAQPGDQPGDQPGSAAPATLTAPAPQAAQSAQARPSQEASPHGVGQVQAEPAPALAFRPRRTKPGAGRMWLRAAAAAIVLAAVGVPTGIAIHQHSVATEAQTQAAQLRALLSEPGAKLSSGQLAGGGSLSVVTTESRTVILTDDLPQLPSDRAYQLWTIASDGEPVSAGLVSASGAGTQLPGVGAGTTVAITVEPAAGSEQPTTQPLGAVKS